MNYDRYEMKLYRRILNNQLKKLFEIFLLIILFFGAALAQESNTVRKSGTVSFVTPQNIYVKFENTEGISAGDTLYFQIRNKVLPAMIVKFISSISVAGQKITDINIKVGDRLFTTIKNSKSEVAQISKAGTEKDTNLVNDHSKIVKADKFNIPEYRSNFYGSISANSFSNYANYVNSVGIQRWNYTLNLNARNIGGGPFYFTNYMNLNYMSSEWTDVKANVFNNLRVYDFSLGYKVHGFNAWIGRHTNYNISSLGPVDGIELEKSFLNNFAVGGVIGSRPDFYNMGINGKLFEYGGYLTRKDSANNGVMQNTVALFQQTNSGMTDRRYLYFQHTNTIIPNVYLFASTEVDLYKEQNNVPQNTFSLTSLFVNTQYSPVNFLSINLSYDARKNVVYYQTFKSFLDSLFTNEMRQGVQGGFFIRPGGGLFFNISGGYSYQKGDVKPARNLNFAVTEAELPFIDISATVNYNKIFGSYQSGTMYGLLLTKFINFNVTTLSLGFSNINYNFGNALADFIQKSVTAEIDTRIFGPLFFNFYYEGDFDGVTTYNRFMTGFNYRFR